MCSLSQSSQRASLSDFLCRMASYCRTPIKECTFIRHSHLCAQWRVLTRCTPQAEFLVLRAWFAVRILEARR